MSTIKLISDPYLYSNQYHNIEVFVSEIAAPALEEDLTELKIYPNLLFDHYLRRVIRKIKRRKLPVAGIFPYLFLISAFLISYLNRAESLAKLSSNNRGKRVAADDLLTPKKIINESRLAFNHQSVLLNSHSAKAQTSAPYQKNKIAPQLVAVKKISFTAKMAALNNQLEHKTCQLMQKLGIFKFARPAISFFNRPAKTAVTDNISYDAGPKKMPMIERLQVARKIAEAAIDAAISGAWVLPELYPAIGANDPEAHLTEHYYATINIAEREKIIRFIADGLISYNSQLIIEKLSAMQNEYITRCLAHKLQTDILTLKDSSDCGTELVINRRISDSEKKQLLNKALSHSLTKANELLALARIPSAPPIEDNAVSMPRPSAPPIEISEPEENTTENQLFTPVLLYKAIDNVA